MKKIKILIIIFTFIISFFVHFIYNYFPSTLTSIFFPVNESVWEHMKIIYTSILITSVIEYCIYKRKDISINNPILNIAITSILGIFLYLLLYSIIDLIIPHNLFISIILLLIVYIICGIISYFILNTEKIRYSNLIGLILIILSYILFMYLTYNPLKISLFLDPLTNTYGI